MIVIENDCCDCGLPCLYENCPYWAVPHFYCDECNYESYPLYWYDGQQLCLDCIEKRLERVKCDD